MGTKGLTKELRRSQLDRALAGVPHMSLGRPRDGWIKTAREILGMTQRQLAQRMSISSPTLSQLEKSEVEGSITLRSLERAASGLHCRVEYFLVPDGGSFEGLIQEKALEVATRAMEMASASMHLENQGVDLEMRQLQIKQLSDDLVRTADKQIWELTK